MYEEDFQDHLSVGAVIKDSKDRILTLYHEKYELWTIPIGKVKLDETYEEACIREIKEEIGISITDMDIIIDNESIEYILLGKKISSKSSVFVIKEYNGDIKNIEVSKHLIMAFLTLDELKDLYKDDQVTEITKLYLNYLQ